MYLLWLALGKYVQMSYLLPGIVQALKMSEVWNCYKYVSCELDRLSGLYYHSNKLCKLRDTSCALVLYLVPPGISVFHVTFPRTPDPDSTIIR